MLMGATILAQLVLVATQPFLRRVFSPEDFGAFGVITSLSIILIDISTFRYEMAVVLPRRDQHAINIFPIILAGALFTSLAILIILLIGNSHISKIVGLAETHKNWMFFLPISVFLLSVYKFFNNWLIRRKAFLSNSINRASRRIVEGSIQILFSLLAKPLGLLIGEAMGNLANNISGIFQAKKCGFDIREITLTRTRLMLKSYSDFPIYNSIPSLLNTASKLLPIVFISKNYTSYLAGQFDLVKLIFIVPVSLVGTAVSQVLLQKISESVQQKQRIMPVILSLITVLSVISVFSILIFRFYAEPFFVFFFGDNWIDAALFARIFVWSFAITFVVTPVSVVFAATNRIKTGSLWQFFYSVFVLVFLVFFDYQKGIHQFLIIYTTINVVLYSLYLALILRTAWLSDTKTLRH